MYVKLMQAIDDNTKDVNCSHCNQALTITADRQEFEIMKSLNSFNTNVQCPTCGTMFFVQLKDCVWKSSTSFID